MTKPEAMKMRLALRVEGHFWNAYIADPVTMMNAALLGSIRMNVIENDPALKTAFMAVMQIAMAKVIEEVIGGPVEGWEEPVAAPQHEKAGRA